MADLSDVELALVNALTTVVYPTGAAGASLTGRPVRIYRGWPMAGSLDADMAAGIANVSVFPIPGATRNVTRWVPPVHTTPGAPTLTVTVNGSSATFGGVGGVGQIAGLLVANQAFVHVGQEGDTPAVVAAVLADSVRASMACWLSGSTVTVPAVTSIIARVVGDGASLTEWARQEQGFRVSAWCPSPMLRDSVCSAIGGALSAVTFLTLADGTAGRLRYRSTASFDDDQDAQLYRRDLLYDVEYGTTLGQAVPSMLFGTVDLAGAIIYA